MCTGKIAIKDCAADRVVAQATIVAVSRCQVPLASAVDGDKVSTSIDAHVECGIERSRWIACRQHCSRGIVQCGKDVEIRTAIEGVDVEADCPRGGGKCEVI